jgi:hypothetical protein
MAKKFEAKLGLDTKEFTGGLDDASGAFGNFGKEIGRISAAITAAGAAFQVLLNWAKEQNFGMEALNVTMHVTRQIMTDLFMGQGFHIKESIQQGKEWAKIQEGNAKDVWTQAKLQKELNQLTVQAADNTLSHAQKLEVLTRAMAKEEELKQFLIDDAKKELKYWKEQLQLNPSNIKAREELYKAAARVEQAMGMDSRRLMSQYTAELKAQSDAAKAAADAIKEYGDMIANIPIPVNPASLGVTSLPNFRQRVQIEGVGVEDILAGAPQMRGMELEISSLQMSLIGLADTFADVFGTIDQGFDAMVKNIIQSINKLVVETFAKAAFLVILSAITGVPLSGAMFKNMLLGPNITGLMNGGVSFRGNSPAPSSGPLQVEVSGVLKGSDIILSNKRFGENN